MSPKGPQILNSPLGVGWVKRYHGLCRYIVLSAVLFSTEPWYGLWYGGTAPFALDQSGQLRCGLRLGNVVDVLLRQRSHNPLVTR
jgi:hypothetical protein